MKADRDRLLAELASRQLSLRAALQEIDRLHSSLEPEVDRLRTDYNAMRRMALDSDETNNRLRAALRVNAIRYQPKLSHDEIDAEIERIVRGDEQSAPAECTHVPMKNALDDGVSCIRCGVDLGWRS